MNKRPVFDLQLETKATSFPETKTGIERPSVGKKGCARSHLNCCSGQRKRQNKSLGATKNRPRNTLQIITIVLIHLGKSAALRMAARGKHFCCNAKIRQHFQSTRSKYAFTTQF